ncbi:MAG: helix-turn-helix domain-containing protein [Alphaproteobacteria bacterium]|nr:helix-turn-helix domain-containing protein [Alphaproteobacteria bacterium]
MFQRKIFAKNLNHIREVHNLTITQIAEILKFKSRSSINDFESARTSPSVEILFGIADLFGVSTDWMLGRSSDAYAFNIDTIKRLEATFYSLLMHPSLVKYPERHHFYEASLHLIHSSNLDLLDSNSSKREEFCPAARANILFALQVLLYASQKYYEDGLGLDVNLPTLISTLFLKGKKTEKALAELCHFCYYDVLEFYWNPHPSLESTFKNTIILDISKEPQSLKDLDSKIIYLSKKQASIY